MLAQILIPILIYKWIGVTAKHHRTVDWQNNTQ